MNDAPPWLKRNERAISLTCIALQLVTLVLQFTAEDESPWVALGVMYVSAAALGLDAVARGVRKRLGEGPSIRNLAPGGWTIFAAMFWIIAVPAYYVGARRRVAEEFPRERVTWGSYAAIGAFALFGGALVLVGVLR